MTLLLESIAIPLLMVASFVAGVRSERRRIAHLPARSIVIGGQLWDVKLSPGNGTLLKKNTTVIGDVPYGKITGRRMR